MNGDTAYFVAFSLFPGIGPVRFTLLYDYFGSAKAAWEAPLTELKAIRLGDRLSEQLVHFRNTLDIASYFSRLEKLHVVPLTVLDAKYPALLREIPDAPFVLYVLGKKREQPLRLERTIAVVGTRRMTPYGKEVTGRFVTELVAQGFTVVSGMAYGIDAAAHWAAIHSGGGTIAVLGCGIDIIAPPGNARLYQAIAGGGGAIVSEMPLGHRPLKGLFPARNRIISGLSLGTLVIEGADDSGALITARNAAEQGREVFAVPGPITSELSRAPARLIKHGATLVESVSDILDALGLQKIPADSAKKRRVGSTKEEQMILDNLSGSGQQIDDLVRLTGLTAQNVAAILTVLEMRGLVRNYGENVFGLV